MDRDTTDILLALRRFIAAPIPGTAWRLRTFLPEPGLIRVRLEDATTRSVQIELPHRAGEVPATHGSWWYVGALRRAARWADDTQADVLTAEDLAMAGVLPDEVEVTEDDGLDYVVADLVGDPYWHEPPAGAAPDLYRLAGFDARDHGVVRLYLALPDRGTIGIDVATTDSESGAARPVGWWASTKLIALLNPDAPESLADLRAPDADDPYCDAVYDATAWT
ncbi:hypothetical protein OG361_40845 [Streptomyces sp. NBC_00090]|uniref:hypothetical protein n=1 Tax=Streptomyces sp. NBC_00090 TaxID=2903619 RepID=UPI0032507EB4